MECRVPNGPDLRVARIEHVAATNGVSGLKLLVSHQSPDKCLSLLWCGHSFWCLKTHDDIEII